MEETRISTENAGIGTSHTGADPAENCTGKNKNRLKIQSAQDQRWTAVTSGTCTASPLRVHASLREKPQTAHG